MRPSGIFGWFFTYLYMCAYIRKMKKVISFFIPTLLSHSSSHSSPNFEALPSLVLINNKFPLEIDISLCSSLSIALSLCLSPSPYLGSTRMGARPARVAPGRDLSAVTAKMATRGRRRKRVAPSTTSGPVREIFLIKILVWIPFFFWKKLWTQLCWFSSIFPWIQLN